MKHAIRKFKVRPCVVCGYPFAHLHHLYPQEFGGKDSPLIQLCPNHHQLVHHIYTVLENGWGEKSLEVVRQYCDTEFKNHWFDYFVGEYTRFRGPYFEEILNRVLLALSGCELVHDPITVFNDRADLIDGNWWLQNQFEGRIPFINLQTLKAIPVPSRVVRTGIENGWLTLPEMPINPAQEYIVRRTHLGFEYVMQIHPPIYTTLALVRGYLLSLGCEIVELENGQFSAIHPDSLSIMINISKVWDDLTQSEKAFITVPI